MKRNKLREYWKIVGRDSNRKLFDFEINRSDIGVNKLQELLRILAAKISLSEEEIVCSCLNRGTKGHLDHLEVQLLAGDKFTYMCGSNPYVTAVAEIENAS